MPCIIRNLFGQFRWLGCGCEVEGQAKRRSIKENFTNECGGKVEFEFLVFEDRSSCSSVQTVSCFHCAVDGVGCRVCAVNFIKLFTLIIAGAMKFWIRSQKHPPSESKRFPEELPQCCIASTQRVDS
jgi:hypothetical protein